VVEGTGFCRICADESPVEVANPTDTRKEDLKKCKCCGKSNSTESIEIFCKQCRDRYTSLCTKGRQRRNLKLDANDALRAAQVIEKQITMVCDALMENSDKSGRLVSAMRANLNYMVEIVKRSKEHDLTARII